MQCGALDFLKLVQHFPDTKFGAISGLKHEDSVIRSIWFVGVFNVVQPRRDFGQHVAYFACWNIPKFGILPKAAFHSL